MERSDHRRRLLVWEPRTGGHRCEHSRYLLDRLRAMPDPPAVRFVVHPDLFLDAPNAAARLDDLPAGVEWHPLATDELRALRGPAPGARMLALLRRKILECRPDATLILDLTPVETALCFRRLPGPVSGLLFVQYPEIDVPDAPPLLHLRRRLKVAFKERKTAAWLRRQDVRSVFLLNGERACDHLSRRFGETEPSIASALQHSPSRAPRPTPAFVAIPDPIAPPPADPAFRLREAYGIPADAAVFLFCGALSRRKGMDVLLDALRSWPPAEAARAVFLCVGRLEALDETSLKRQADGLRRARPDVRVRMDLRFVPDGELQAMIEQADWPLEYSARPPRARRWSVRMKVSSGD